MQEEIIKKYFDAANAIVISEMYLNSFPNGNIDFTDLKKYNPGHLGTSMSINFILANLYYFLNNENLNSQIIIGTGHAGVSLMANLWLNGTLSKYYPKYDQSREGLNNLIKDFGTSIRSEINPEYPETIYDGGELGYSLGVAYGYAIEAKTDIVPCIIGDGEAETGTLMASWQLARLLNTKSKVLPIINLNGLKMGSNSYLSMMSREELTSYFTSLGYNPLFVSTSEKNPISKMQVALNETLNLDNPLIIFSSPKGYTLTEYENDISVHKNPLAKIKDLDKLRIIRNMLTNYDMDIFDEDDKLIKAFANFKISSPSKRDNNIKVVDTDGEKSPDEYLYKLVSLNNGLIFSPDEIYSNQFPKCSEFSFELLNENVLEAMYQGYIMAGGNGYYIAYEGFMPVISSMLTQYYKYLKQKGIFNPNEKSNSLNYILTSTCWENTYSHQNPDIVNTLYEKEDSFYNIIYPKDSENALSWIKNFANAKDKINLLILSKRHQKKYPLSDEPIEIIKDTPNPDIVLCATGDYMLDIMMDVSNELTNNGINPKVVYVTKPQILSPSNSEALTEDEFIKYFNEDTPSIYLYCGYPSIIKSLLYDRHTNTEVLGYADGLSVFGSFENNALASKISKEDILDICTRRLRQSKTLKRRK